ncbi:aldo/keto reductase [Acidipila sp. EB88]|uniref:aldo/keto reductase n=1 Tax=Acidipila sp. EB88 TaxID=2305226 RepID=UPI000F5F4A66|nr:aldo/keto reductase [Acidipila sp. EB88]RRA48373.1 aldo/keto reductase [Acidipila sp. EB88]
MEKRAIGQSPLQVTPLMLGGNVFGWTADEQTSFRILDRFVDAGGNFIDTADVYSRWAEGHTGGESERILGKWFRQSGKRDKVVLATKVGMDMGDGKQGLKPAYIRQAIEASLERLQTDRIELYQSHKDDEATPLPDTLAAYGELIAEGKVIAIGASNYKADRLRAALELASTRGLPRYESLQPHYNLLERGEYENTLAPVVNEFGIAVVPYFSLAAGFLTGKYRSAADVEGKARGKMVGKYANEHGFGVVKALDEVASEVGGNPTQVALAWLMARPGITAPIASATSLEQLEDLLKAVELKLPTEAIEKLNEVSQPAVVA